jgi:hypothetical protein
LELLSENGVAVLFVETNGETHGPARLPPSGIVPFELKSKALWLFTFDRGFECKHEVLDSVSNPVVVRVGFRGDEVSVGMDRFDDIGGARDTRGVRLRIVSGDQQQETECYGEG